LISVDLFPSFNSQIQGAGLISVDGKFLFPIPI
jgi:hypothetical protein